MLVAKAVDNKQPRLAEKYHQLTFVEVLVGEALLHRQRLNRTPLHCNRVKVSMLIQTFNQQMKSLTAHAQESQLEVAAARVHLVAEIVAQLQTDSCWHASHIVIQRSYRNSGPWLDSNRHLRAQS